MHRNSIIEASKNLSIRQNVSFRVIDETTGKVVQEHIGHNSATNSLLFGIAHHLVGDFVPNEGHSLNPGYAMLSNYVPRYISLGTMGLINQHQDSHGLPAGIGDTIPGQGDEEYERLLQELQDAANALSLAKEALALDCQYWPACDACAECQECATRIGAKKQAVDDAQAAYNAAYDAVMTYNETARFVEYMEKVPGYGADGYDLNQNNGRKYPGLGYAYSSYSNTSQYFVNDITSWQGYLYKCIQDTPDPAGAFSETYWQKMDDIYQPSIGTTIQLELISATFPREPISYRDIVPEYQAELPRTIDVVFSAMISTGALKQFRPAGQDYIFITEAGLWSRNYWDNSGENGLLAGYRIVPPNMKNWDMTVQANRDLLKRQILKVGKNQVVQVVWKIQIGAVEHFASEVPEPETYTPMLFNVIDSDTDRYIPHTFVKVTTDLAGEVVVPDARSGDALSWETNSNAKLAYLTNGTYYFHEITPAAGYLPSDPVVFTVTDGEVDVISQAGYAEDTAIYMTNEVDIPTSQAIDMSQLTAYTENSEGHVHPVAVSETETSIVWDGSVYLGCNFYYSTPVNVTDWDTITLDVLTGPCYGGGDTSMPGHPDWELTIGLLDSQISNAVPIVYTDGAWKSVVHLNRSNYNYSNTELDVHNLAGLKYLTVCAAGWNATLENATLRRTL